MGGEDDNDNDPGDDMGEGLDNRSDDNGDVQIHVNKFNFLLTNARSLAPKIDSFVENFEERNIDLCVVTETWCHDGVGLLEDDGVDLRLGEGISSFHCGRSAERRGGGVGIFFRESRIKACEITPKDNPHEICAVLCSLRGLSLIHI